MLPVAIRPVVLEDAVVACIAYIENDDVQLMKARKGMSVICLLHNTLSNLRVHPS